MNQSKVSILVQEMFAPSDVRINGSRPWDIQVHHPGFYDRVLSGGSLALGDSYMDGWWDCEALDRFFERILAHRLDKKAAEKSIRLLWAVLMA
ncbi:MAG: cyclopropane-fatty-acyl-phospholipid synthase, partial [Deltaproteobacteria bacterium]|nr:cyclopropane-fatty-acyl-phospholipid synthase [Deltaproteobacteria bacterium]